MIKLTDGNKACAHVAQLFSEVCAIYPITPSSPIAAEVSKLSDQGKENLLGGQTKVVEMQSEAGAAGALHGALISGSLASTFTSSQGLLLMIPNMYKIAGEMLPGVIHVAARSLSTHALSIFGDHQDIYATRSTGFCILASSNVEEAGNMAAIAHLSAVEGGLPFLHFYDGFRTSHEINTVNVLSDGDLKGLFDLNLVNKYKNKIINVGNNIQSGLAQNEDIYFQVTEARNNAYNEMVDIVVNNMNKVNDILGTNYKPFEFYGSPKASDVIVVMGSASDTTKLVVDFMNKNGYDVGMVSVHLYRPFSKEHLKSVLPDTVKRIAVLDRTKEAGSYGEPLYLDVLASLRDTNIEIVGGRYGLSSKEVDPADIKSVFTMMMGHMRHNFTIGINDDVTKLSLPRETFNIDLCLDEVRIFGYGSDGMVSASKEMLKILSENKGMNAQGYFEYDSRKSGGVTVSHLRVGRKVIRAPYYVKNPNYVVVTKLEYLNKYDCLEGIKERGVLLVNTSLKEAEFDSYIKGEVKTTLFTKNIMVYLVDANKLADENNLHGKINKIMEVIILRILGVNDSTKIVGDYVKDAFRTKGEDVINNNLKALEDALYNINVYNAYAIGDELPNEDLNVFEMINRRMGDLLKVSDLIPYKNGMMPNNLAVSDKKITSEFVPIWNKETCIGCGNCSLVCPHGAIRVILNEEDGIEYRKDNKYKLKIAINKDICTGCMECIKTCPVSKDPKPLKLVSYDEAPMIDKEEFLNHVNIDSTTDDILGSQLKKSCIMNPGACAGCGETPYIKLLTQLFGEKLVIANATGCSSIYGGSAPRTPYSIPWASSLFEDNAEFGFGMLLSYNQKREHLKNAIEKYYDTFDSNLKSIFDKLKDNFDSFEETIKIKDELIGKDLPIEIYNLIDYVPSRSVWTLGGDGWAYDIGFGGIDHVLLSNTKARILVLDTEVYSNTGGQMSKSSQLGQVAEFANFGKKNNKKDLFRIAMAYPNCYVASISLGANPIQAIKAFKEAENNDGPSIIIAYSPCIEHGIKSGCANKEEKLVVESGYTLLMRYNPGEDKLYLDSKEPNYEKLDDIWKNETRFNALKIKDEKLAKELLEEQKEFLVKRYNYYKEISSKQNA
ncbi:MAG: pyruvate:ferredoxin (flavodoxin) oxidoreductase [Bacilli bacterium]|nr:pyruvate:ferredoxin (flavodoxin) oxidoreductase [Bacilli bacterium]